MSPLCYLEVRFQVFGMHGTESSRFALSLLMRFQVISCNSYGNFLYRNCSSKLFWRITEGTKLWENLKVLEEHIGHLLRSFQILYRFRAPPITTMCRFYAIELVQGSLIMFDEASERSPVFG